MPNQKVVDSAYFDRRRRRVVLDRRQKLHLWRRRWLVDADDDGFGLDVLGTVGVPSMANTGVQEHSDHTHSQQEQNQQNTRKNTDDGFGLDVLGTVVVPSMAITGV